MSSLKEIIRADFYRYTNSLGFMSFLRTYVKDRGFRYVFWFRCAQAATPVLSTLAKYKLFRMKGKYGLDISWKTQIGPGLYLGHGQSIVISHKAKIGKNFNISQFCSIGTNEGQAATIGDNVYVGPNVCIVEAVQIGNRVTIGAGSVVVKDIPSDATAVGVPARVVHFNRPARYIKT
ncbi:serine acetyltransferase [Chitinibacter tainanensis]|uniref:serine acetyltransferase n=1 Tax=Chitinibacter tainanensis TaxID=230667 RepID=UPI002352BDEF|nr:hypothetical protein [Chitinibacter tainanensis]